MAKARLTELQLGRKKLTRILITIYYLALAAERAIANPVPEKHCKHWVLGGKAEVKCYLAGQI